MIEKIGASVILQACKDLFDPSLEREERVEAFRFLTDKDGEWAESRQAWCLMVGRDQNRLRTRIIRALRLRSPTASVGFFGPAPAAPAAP